MLLVITLYKGMSLMDLNDYHDDYIKLLDDRNNLAMQVKQLKRANTLKDKDIKKLGRIINKHNKKQKRKKGRKHYKNGKRGTNYNG